MFKKIVFTLILAFYLTEFNAQKLVPNIPLETFKGTYTTMNKELSEDNFYILSFWATWCVPCINELDALNEVYDELSDKLNFKVLAISTDDARTMRRVRPLVNGKSYYKLKSCNFHKFLDLFLFVFLIHQCSETLFHFE